jgi:hypothetical protein
MYTKDMTRGKPPGLLVGFTLLFMAGNIFHQLYIIADASIVGRFVGIKALAALGGRLDELSCPESDNRLYPGIFHTDVLVFWRRGHGRTPEKLRNVHIPHGSVGCRSHYAAPGTCRHDAAGAEHTGDNTAHSGAVCAHLL